jgi:hypothetical protein
MYKVLCQKVRSVGGSRKVPDQAKSSGSGSATLGFGCKNGGRRQRKSINPSFCHVQWVLVKIFDDDSKARDPR